MLYIHYNKCNIHTKNFKQKISFITNIKSYLLPQRRMFCASYSHCPCKQMLCTYLFPLLCSNEVLSNYSELSCHVWSLVF